MSEKIDGKTYSGKLGGSLWVIGAGALSAGAPGWTLVSQCVVFTATGALRGGGPASWTVSTFKIAESDRFIARGRDSSTSALIINL